MRAEAHGEECTSDADVVKWEGDGAIAKDTQVHTICAEDKSTGRVLAAARVLVSAQVVCGKSLRCAHLQFVCVEESLRNRGIGSGMLARAEAIAADEGCCEIELEVEAHNEGACRLYERLGYKRVVDPVEERMRMDRTWCIYLGPRRTLTMAKRVYRAQGALDPAAERGKGASTL